MLKRVFVLVIFAIYGSVSLAQNIDQLNTDEEVLSFVRGLGNDYKNLYLYPPKPVMGFPDFARFIGIRIPTSYEKTDFDGNGYSDLLFNGYCDDYAGNQTCRRISFVVLSFGKDSFRVKELTKGTVIDFFTAHKIQLDGQNCIETLNIQREYDDSNASILKKQVDTLSYVLDEFIERSKPNNDTIQKIEYCIFGGLGSFVPFKLFISDTSLILKNATSGMEPQSLLDSGGIFEAQLNPMVYSRIIGLLRYIDFAHLKEQYAVRWTDALVGFIQITYNSGKIKKIQDYGLIGTYGLAALQRAFIEMRDSQHWKKIRQGDDVFFSCNN